MECAESADKDVGNQSVVELAYCPEAAGRCARLPLGQAVTNATTNPSYPLLPTVWTTVADRRRSAATSSLNRRTPCTLASVLFSSTTAPLRTTLSAMIRLPGRDSRIAQDR